MTVEPLRDVRNHFSDVIERVEHEQERVTVTRNGRPVAVILSPDDLEEMEETLAVLNDRRRWPASARGLGLKEAADPLTWLVRSSPDRGSAAAAA